MEQGKNCRFVRWGALLDPARLPKNSHGACEDAAGAPEFGYALEFIEATCTKSGPFLLCAFSQRPLAH